MKTEITLGQFKIGERQAPMIVAEMSGNHNQSLDRALQIVDAAALAGASALKIQTYTADTMTLDLDASGFVIEDQKSLWQGKKLYDLYKEAYTPWEWHKPIMERCRAHGMEFFSTPFDRSSVDFLETLGVAFYKIASFENTDLPLIRYVAKTGKPVIVSTGMADFAEIEAVVNVMKEEKNENLILLKCTSSYPAEPIHSHIRTIVDMRQKFNCLIGLSDHTTGIGAAVASVTLGAVLIEKHFTLNRADGGVDSAFSLEPSELKSLVTESKRAWQALGEVRYGPNESEKKSLIFRRSLFAVMDIKAGETLTEENVRSLRPCLGMPAKHLPEVLGRSARHDIKKGTPLTFDHLA